MSATSRYDQRLAEKLFSPDNTTNIGGHARAIPRLNTSSRELDFIAGNSAVGVVMVPINNIRWLVADGHDAESLFDCETTVISTTTIKDSKLRNLSWEEERDLVRAFKPDLHIPTDYSVYEDMTEREQQEAIHDCKLGTVWMAKQLADVETQILVQVKGWKEWHFEACLPLFNEFQTNICAYYVSGYAGSEIGNQSKALKADVRRLIRVVKPSTVVLVGRQSPNDIANLPPEVQAAAGKRWLFQSIDANDNLSQKNLVDFLYRLEQELGRGQTQLSNFLPSEVTSNG